LLYIVFRPRRRLLLERLGADVAAAEAVLEVDFVDRPVGVLDRARNGSAAGGDAEHPAAGVDHRAVLEGGDAGTARALVSALAQFAASKLS